MNNSFKPFKNNEVSNLDYINDLEKQGKVKEAKKQAISVLCSNMNITKQVDQIGLTDLLKKYSIDEIVDYVSFQGLIQTLEVFYDVNNLDFGIEENKNSINNIISNKSGFVKIKSKPNIKKQSSDKKHFFIKERPNYEKEASQYFCSIKDITNLDQIDIDKLKKHLSYSSKCDNIVVISQSFYLFGKIGDKIDEGNKKNNTKHGELLNLKNNYITNDNFIYTINKVISSPHCNAQGIGNMFYGLKNSTIDISEELLKRVINKLISLPDCNAQSIWNMFYGLKNSIVDIDKETLKKVINKLISLPDCNERSIGNVFYGLENSKINISKETLEKVISKFFSLPVFSEKGVFNIFFGLQNSKVEISKKVIDLIKTHFSYEIFFRLFKRLNVEQFNNLLDLKGIFPEKYQIELELMKLYKEEKYTEGLKFFEGIKEEYTKEFVDYKIKYLRKLKRYDEVIKEYGDSINSLNIDSQIEIAYVLFNNNKGKEALKIFGDIINKKMLDPGRITRLYTGIIFCLSINNGLMDDFGKNLFEIAIKKIKSFDLDKLPEDEIKHIKNAIYKAKYIKN